MDHLVHAVLVVRAGVYHRYVSPPSRHRSGVAAGTHAYRLLPPCREWNLFAGFGGGARYLSGTAAIGAFPAEPYFAWAFAGVCASDVCFGLPLYSCGVADALVRHHTALCGRPEPLAAVSDCRHGAGMACSAGLLIPYPATLFMPDDNFAGIHLTVLFLGERQ